MINDKASGSKKILFILFISITMALVLLMKNSFFQKTKSEVLPFGSADNWLIYHQSHESFLKGQKIKSVKAVFYMENKKTQELHYIVSLKKHEEKRKKDGRYEFLGGKVDKKEKILEALMRETAEEDPSLILANRLSYIFSSEINKLKYKLVTLKNGSIHAVFVLPLLATEWQKLDDYYKNNSPENTETYGFEKLDASYFSLEKEKKVNWTPQTVRIFKALRRESKKAA